LTLLETSILVHLLATISMFAALISILTIFYGDLLIVKYKLEAKLAKFIQLRRQFQQYYLLGNIFFTILVMIVYFNLLILFNH